jgi:hypothetical protein
MTIEHSITVHPSNEIFKQVSHEKNGRFSRYGFFLSITSLLNQNNETRRPVIITQNGEPIHFAYQIVKYSDIQTTTIPYKESLEKTFPTEAIRVMRLGSR